MIPYHSQQFLVNLNNSHPFTSQQFPSIYVTAIPIHLRHSNSQLFTIIPSLSQQLAAIHNISVTILFYSHMGLKSVSFKMILNLTQEAGS